VPHFVASVCDSRGAGITVVGSPSTATGCIAVLTTKHDDQAARHRGEDHDD